MTPMLEKGPHTLIFSHTEGLRRAAPTLEKRPHTEGLRRAAQTLEKRPRTEGLRRAAPVLAHLLASKRSNLVFCSDALPACATLMLTSWCDLRPASTQLPSSFHPASAPLRPHFQPHRSRTFTLLTALPHSFHSSSTASAQLSHFAASAALKRSSHAPGS